MWTYSDLDPYVKLGLLIIAGFLAVRFPIRRTPALRKIKVAFRRLAARPWLCCFLICGVSVLINIGLTSIHYPQPQVHDEFSYLLASETFSSGRLTNPPHPMAEHFETYHVLSEPTYMSKYPPGSALVMGFGEWLTGQPIVGVWLAFVLACAALFWMLRSWTSPQWAALGTLLVATNGLLLRAWCQSWWGGSVALMGGALVFGGLHRIWNADRNSSRQPKFIDAALLGIGLVSLSISRPMEGMFVSLPVIGSLLYWYISRNDVSLSSKTWKVAVPIVAIGFLGLAGIAKYNSVVTGDAMTMPYMAHDRAYSASSLVLWKTPPAIPEYTHPRMKRFYMEFGRERQLSLRSGDVYWNELSRKLRLLWSFLPMGIGFSLIPLFLLWKDPWWRMVLCILGGLLLVNTQLSASWIYPHYIAPALAIFFALNVQCLRQIRVWQRQRGWGSVLVNGIVILALLKLIPVFLMWSAADTETPRQHVINQLSDEPVEKHLVICSYAEDYPIYTDWVYNGADIDASKIVWARDMSESKNAQLLEYYADRKVWRCHFESDESVNLRAINQDDAAVQITKISENRDNQ